MWGREWDTTLLRMGRDRTGNGAQKAARDGTRTAGIWNKSVLEIKGNGIQYENPQSTTSRDKRDKRAIKARAS